MEDTEVLTNSIDEDLITDLLSCYGALFVLVTAKLAHLKEGDPFKERCNAFCFLLVKVLVGYMDFMLPPVTVPEPPNKRGLRLYQGARTMVKRLGGTLVRRTGETAGDITNLNREFNFDVAPLDAAQEANRVIRLTRTEGAGEDFPFVLPSLQVKRNKFNEANTALFNLAGNIRDETAFREAERQVLLMREVLNVIENNKPLREGVSPLRIKYRLIQMKMKDMQMELRDRVTAYYVDRLNCTLNIETCARLINEPNIGEENRRKNLGKFDFQAIVDLEVRIINAVTEFYDATGDVVYDDEEDRDGFNLHGKNRDRTNYNNTLVNYLDTGVLDPFENYSMDIEEPLIIPGEKPVDVVKLVKLAAEIAPETEVRF